MISYREAKQELVSYVNTNWINGLTNGLTNSIPVLPAMILNDGNQNYIPELAFRNIEMRNSMPKNKHFGKFTHSNFARGQTSLPGGRTEGSVIKHTSNGVGAIQLFFSRRLYSTDQENYICAICEEMFTNKRTVNIWFRNAVIVDLPEEENYFRTNVTFEYTFDTATRN